MKKYIVLIAFIIFIPLGEYCCIMGQQQVRGSGPVIKQERRIKDVQGVRLTTFGDLTITMGNEEKFELEAQENLHDYFTVEVNHGLLADFHYGLPRTIKLSNKQHHRSERQ